METLELVIIVNGVMLCLILMVVVGIRAAVRRLETRIGHQSVTRDPAVFQPLPDESETKGGAFEAFLAEDPKRHLMTKADQSAAFRQWRREKGMNWSNS